MSKLLILILLASRASATMCVSSSAMESVVSTYLYGIASETFMGSSSWGCHQSNQYGSPQLSLLSCVTVSFSISSWLLMTPSCTSCLGKQAAIGSPFSSLASPTPTGAAAAAMALFFFSWRSLLQLALHCSNVWFHFVIDTASSDFGRGFPGFLSAQTFFLKSLSDSVR